MNALYAIPYAAPVTVSHGGLLASPDWWYPLAYGLVLLMALLSVPGQARESAKALWAPAAAFLRRLYVPWLWGRLCSWYALSGAFLAPLWGFRWDNWPEDDVPDEQKRRLAYPGFDRPVLT